MINIILGYIDIRNDAMCLMMATLFEDVADPHQIHKVLLRLRCAPRAAIMDIRKREIISVINREMMSLVLSCVIRYIGLIKHMTNPKKQTSICIP